MAWRAGEPLRSVVATVPSTVTRLKTEYRTIAETLKEAGYATGHFGKWHLGYENDYWAGNQGFDVAKGGIDLPWAWTLCYPSIEEAPTAKTWPKTHTRLLISFTIGVGLRRCRCPDSPKVELTCNTAGQSIRDLGVVCQLGERFQDGGG